MKNKLLLHACCAPCVTHPFQLNQDEYDVTVFFYNPNIQPIEEYEARKREIQDLSNRWNFPLIVGEYDTDTWQNAVKGRELDPEGEARCKICYALRMKKTAQLARKTGYPIFTTTLSISPHKKAEVINAIGHAAAVKEGVGFLKADFKKKEGFKISSQISQKEGLYRQNYCGCSFSRRQD